MADIQDNVPARARPPGRHPQRLGQEGQGQRLFAHSVAPGPGVGRAQYRRGGPRAAGLPPYRDARPHCNLCQNEGLGQGHAGGPARGHAHGAPDLQRLWLPGRPRGPEDSHAYQRHSGGRRGRNRRARG
eukprot:8557182-Lingulodinium_polyedra.AAC.1